MRYKGSLQSIPDNKIFYLILTARKMCVYNILLLIYYFPLNLQLNSINSNVFLL